MNRRTAINVASLAIAAAIPLGFEALPLLDGLEAANPWVKPTAIVFLFLVGSGLVVFHAVRAYRDEVAIAVTDDIVNDLRIAVKESLLPVATLLAEMSNKTQGEKRHHVERVSDKAVSVLAYLLLRHVPKVRANVFAINRANTKLEPISSGGAGDPPGAFEAGREPTDRNLTWVLEGGPVRWVRNVRSTASEEGGRHDAKYDSYVAVVIRSGMYSYGMLTVDSAASDPFTDTDVQTVKVVAELLAVGMSMAYPGENAGTSS